MNLKNHNSLIINIQQSVFPFSLVLYLYSFIIITFLYFPVYLIAPCAFLMIFLLLIKNKIKLLLSYICMFNRTAGSFYVASVVYLMELAFK
jgi:hypothetical protein